MIRIMSLTSVLLMASAAVAQVQQSVILREDEVLSLPNGRRVVLIDDNKSKGIEIYIDGAGLMRLPQGQSVSVGSFVLTCEAYDLDHDAARIGVFGPPLTTIRQEPSPPPQPRRWSESSARPKRYVNSSRPMNEVEAKEPEKANEEPYAFNKSRSAYRRGTLVPQAFATTQPAREDPARQERAFDLLNKAETSLNNALVYAGQFDELLRVEPDISGQLKKRYYIVVMLYAYRLLTLGVKEPEPQIHRAIQKAKTLPDKLDPFSICPACWTAGAKTLWERTDARL